ncbi:MAG: hypothetical protein ACYS80_26795 [Planctomycetota bacterium]
MKKHYMSKLGLIIAFTFPALCFEFAIEKMAILNAVPLVLAEESPVTPGYQAAFLFKGNSANDHEPGWNFEELQGVANGDPGIGDAYWYFSRLIKRFPENITYLYRVSYGEHLGSDFARDLKIVRLQLLSGTLHCNHVGDIDYHQYNKKGYIVAPYDHCTDQRAYLAVFRANDLGDSGDYIDVHALIDVASVQNDAAIWAAVTSDGRIFSASRVPADNAIYEYTVEWNDIQKGGKVDYSRRKIFLFFNEPGGDIPGYWQGGDFSSDDELFYFAHGESGGPGHIFVFEVKSENTNWYSIRKSSNSDMPFKFEVHAEEETEGCSYFDMNSVAGYHPEMPRGELHVILLNNDIGSPDNAWIRHYSSVIDVANGESVHHTYYDKWGEGVWNGSILRIETGTINEKVTLSGKRVKIVSGSGPVIIGK